MAIKVNGTTVINDSRQLQNVASVDATTVAALGAAGVGGSSAYATTTYTSSAVGIIRNTDPNYGSNTSMSKGNTRDQAPLSAMQGWVQLLPAGTTGFIKVSVDKSKFTLYKYADDQYPYWSAVVNVIMYDKYSEKYRVLMDSPVHRSLFSGGAHGQTLTGTVDESYVYNYYPSGASIILMMGGSYHDANVLRGGVSAAAGALTIEYLSNET